MTKFLVMGIVLAVCAVPAAAGGDVEAGHAKAKTCAVCHGPDGNSAAADYPKLAGQHYSYLYRALRDYKSGLRKNPIMGANVQALNQHDLQDLAAYFAAQKGLELKK